MVNSVFVLGQYFVDRGFNEPFTHVSATVLQDNGTEFVPSAGMSYGTPHGFNVGQQMLNKPMTHALYVPISPIAVQRFERLMSDLKTLYEQDRLPYHFSKYGLVNTVIEGRNKTRLDVYGQEHSVAWADNAAYAKTVDAMGNVIKCKDLVWPEDVPIIGVNCMQLLNFAARVSGIDLTKLSDDFWTIYRGPAMAKRVSEIFESTARGHNKAMPDFKARWTSINDQTIGQTHYAGLSALIDRNALVDESPFYLREHLRFLSLVAGGPEQLRHYFRMLEPWDAEPIERPKYLQDLLTGLNREPSLEAQQDHAQ